MDNEVSPEAAWRRLEEAKRHIDIARVVESLLEGGRAAWIARDGASAPQRILRGSDGTILQEATFLAAFAELERVANNHRDAAARLRTGAPASLIPQENA